MASSQEKYAKEKGRRALPCGTEVKYELLYPRASAPTGVAVLVHGFSRDHTVLLGDAQRIAEQGLIAFAADMVTLIWGESAQIRNIDGVADHVRWLIRRGETEGDALSGLVDPHRVVLVGHSAGGAVCSEAAWRLQAARVPPAALVLLDAVPWPRTLKEVPPRLQPLPLCSVRCEPSLWNKKNVVLTLLKELPFSSNDLFAVGAAHLDPERPLKSPGWLERWAVYLVGLLPFRWLWLRGRAGARDEIGQLTLSYICSVLRPQSNYGPSFAELQQKFSAEGFLQVASVGPRQR